MMLLRFERGHIDSLQYTPPSNIISVEMRNNLHPSQLYLKVYISEHVQDIITGTIINRIYHDHIGRHLQ